MSWLEELELVNQMGLSADELCALSRQGFVQREVRSNGREYFKLRFRMCGRQRVYSLGTDGRIAEQAEREVATLQSGRRLELETSELAAQARRMLRTAKQDLSPLLTAAGWHFHGMAVRRIAERNCT